VMSARAAPARRGPAEAREAMKIRPQRKRVAAGRIMLGDGL